MPKHKRPRNDYERVDFEEREARIKRNINLAFEATKLSKRDFTRICFPGSCDITSDSKNVFNWLRTGQIAKPMLIPFSKATGVPLAFLLGEEDKIVEWDLESKLRQTHKGA